jgi:hypothetical protein
MPEHYFKKLLEKKLSKVLEAPILRPERSYDPDANDAYNTATNRQPPKYDYDPEVDYRPGTSLGRIPNIQSETEVIQMPNRDLYLFYSNTMPKSTTPEQKTMWQKFVKAMLHNPKANQTGPNKEKNVVGFLKLKPFEDGYRVAGVGMDPEIRGQGKAIKLYLAFSAWKGFPIYSDFTQTPSAKTMWNSITARYPKRVVAYDQTTKKDIPLDKAGQMYQDQPDKFDSMTQHQAKEVLGNTKLLKLLPESIEAIQDTSALMKGIDADLKQRKKDLKKKMKASVYEEYTEITQSKKEEIVSAWEYQEDLIDIGNGYQILSGENHGYADNLALLIGPDYKIVDKDTDIGKLLDDNFGIIQGENFADGKVKGKSRPGRVKKAGASCKGSVTSLRKKAKNSSGEKSKMYHWCANMKSGKKKK